MDTMRIQLLLLLRIHLQQTPLNHSLQLGECSQYSTKTRLRRHASCGSTASAQRNSLLLGLVLLLEISSLDGSRTYQRTTRIVQITDLMVNIHIRSSKLQYGKGLRSVLWGFQMFTKISRNSRTRYYLFQESLQTVLEGPSCSHTYVSQFQTSHVTHDLHKYSLQAMLSVRVQRQNG